MTHLRRPQTLLRCTALALALLGSAGAMAQAAPDADHFLANGAKFYSTGSIFADWIDLYSQRTDTGAVATGTTGSISCRIACAYTRISY